MRRACGIGLMVLGLATLGIYGFVMLRIPPPRLVLRLIRAKELLLYVDPVIEPLVAGVALVSGLLLLRRKPLSP